MKNLNRSFSFREIMARSDRSSALNTLVIPDLLTVFGHVKYSDNKLSKKLFQLFPDLVLNFFSDFPLDVILMHYTEFNILSLQRGYQSGGVPSIVELTKSIDFPCVFLKRDDDKAIPPPPMPVKFISPALSDLPFDESFYGSLSDLFVYSWESGLDKPARDDDDNVCESYFSVVGEFLDDGYSVEFM